MLGWKNLDIGKVSTSQRPGLVTCIRKEGTFIFKKPGEPLPYYV